MSVATCFLYTTTMYDRYEKQLASIVTYVGSHIDNDDMAECADTFVESEKYKEFQAFIDDFVDNYDDVHYVYIMKVVGPEDPIEIYEICAGNTTYEKQYEPENVMHLGDGEAGWYTKETAQQFREILQGDKDVYFVNPSAWGVDYTLARPLVNSKGEHYGLMCADISLDQINETVYRNIYINIAMIIIPGIAFILLIIFWMRRNVTRPLKELENGVTEFAESSTGKRNPDDLLYVPPEIHTGNEVESLANAITKLSVDMRDYVKDIVAAENEARGLQDHVSEMSAIVYKDVLTHVGNRAAYEVTAGMLGKEIEDGKAKFAVVMVDLNHLKQINDQYGHDKGNEYIVGACEVMCDVYAHSPVFRIGGDEFVAVLTGRDYEAREELLDRLRDAFAQSSKASEREPWHRYSAAVGMAVYKPGDGLDTVFVEADQAMYDAKAEMKAKAAL